jgi:hypothetical protein
VDSDIEPLVPLKDYIEDDDEFVTCISGNYNRTTNEWKFNPHFIMSNKENPLLQECINKYIFLYNNYRNQYYYWNWSICKLMTTIEMIEKKSHTCIINHMKHKFLFELPEWKDVPKCEYNGKVVFHNKYANYKDHNFVKD